MKSEKRGQAKLSQSLDLPQPLLPPAQDHVTRGLRSIKAAIYCGSMLADFITAAHRSTSSRMYLDVFPTEPPKIPADNFLS
jgi:hypothetical protein